MQVGYTQAETRFPGDQRHSRAGQAMFRDASDGRLDQLLPAD
jgi:hypothetical protein